MGKRSTGPNSLHGSMVLEGECGWEGQGVPGPGAASTPLSSDTGVVYLEHMG